MATPLSTRKKPGLTQQEVAARDNVIEQIGLLQARMREAGEMPWGSNSLLRLTRRNFLNMSPEEVQTVRNTLRRHIVQFKTKMRNR